MLIPRIGTALRPAEADAVLVVGPDGVLPTYKALQWSRGSETAETIIGPHIRTQLWTTLQWSRGSETAETAHVYLGAYDVRSASMEPRF